MTIRTAIIEDVPLARERLRRMLEPHPDLRFVGEAGDMQTGAALLSSTAPDLVFLDVTLPDGEGPDLLRPVPPSERPLIVFLTAATGHALPAFELEALDYLLKPVGEAELSRAIDRVRRRLAPEREGVAETHVAIRDGRSTELVPVEAIDFVEVAGHYLCLHVGDRVHLLREPLAAFAERHGPARFVRCHRSILVRPGAIVRLTERRNGDADLRLVSGAVIAASRTYRPDLATRLPALGS